MRNSDKSIPCYNCTKRCAKCHSSCEDYKEYRERAARERDLVYKQRNAEAAYIETRVKSAYKTANKRRQQKAWGG